MRRIVARLAILVGALVVFAPSAAWAQSSIVGVVRDTSGAVLPGVTVEAASPALIEKVRSAVTDSQGLYSIIDLRPGVYSVTFTLPGFQTAKRDNLDLPSAFTATVNGELQVGSIAETLTVSGEAPVVDLRNSGRQQTVSQELLSSVPTGSTPQSYAVLLPSVTLGLGNITTAPNSFRWADMTFRGTRGASTSIDGFDTSHRLNGEGSQYQVNEGMVQEIVVSLGSAGAETQGAGITINVIPKSGGNRFSGSFSTHWANDDFVADNITPELERLGITTQSIRKSWDFNPSFGGPIARDKVWFFASYRNIGNATDTGIRRDTNPLDWVYTRRHVAVDRFRAAPQPELLRARHLASQPEEHDHRAWRPQPGRLEQSWRHDRRRTHAHGTGSHRVGSLQSAVRRGCELEIARQQQALH